MPRRMSQRLTASANLERHTVYCVTCISRLVSIVALFGLGDQRAQGDDSGLIPLKQIRVFEQVSTLRYSTSVKTTLDAKDFGYTNKSTVTRTGSYIAKGAHFLITAEQTKPDIGSGFKLAFNGEKTQNLYSDDSLLTLRGGLQQGNPALASITNYFKPFSFLYPQIEETGAFIMALPEAKDTQHWQERLGAAVPRPDADFAGYHCSVFRFPGGMDATWEKKFNYDVYFAKELDGYPVGYRRNVGEGFLDYVYTVTEIGSYTQTSNNAVFRYPKASKEETFMPNGKLIRKAEFVISELKINEEVADDLFTIDPGGAGVRYVEDVDAGVTIDTTVSSDSESY